MPPRRVVGTQPHHHLTAFYKDAGNRDMYLQDLFDDTAADYDRILAFAFFASGNRYRHRALHWAGLQAGQRLLDVACGTGVLAAQALKTLEPDQIVCVDPSPAMRAVAKQKLGDQVRVLAGKAESLPVDDEAFDLLTMGYALRHVTTLEDAFTEYFRVLRPGGKVLLLEISRPDNRFVRLLVRFYMRDVVPVIGRMVARKKRGHTLMRYFWESIDYCVPPATILHALEHCGFADVSCRTQLGIFSAYTGTKPPATAPAASL